MKTMPIITNIDSFSKKNSFKGTTKYFAYDANNHLKIQDTPTGVGTQLYDNFSSSLESLSPKFTKIYNAFDRRKARTGKIYFGDPDEKIDLNKVLKDHDYAVSDIMPEYPNIDKVSAGYFYTDNTRYDEHFKAIADFHDRRETAAKRFETQYRKNLSDGINPQDSKEKIDYYVWQQKDSFAKRREALEALEIYNKANTQKATKEEQGRELQSLYEQRGSTKKDIEYANFAIKNYTKTIENNEELIKIINKRISLYEKLQELPEDTINKLNLKWRNDNYIHTVLRLSIFKLERMEIIDNITDLKGFIQQYDKANITYKQNIENKHKLIQELRTRIEKLSVEIANKENAIAASKAKLIPLFDELKAFYLKHGIK